MSICLLYLIDLIYNRNGWLGVKHQLTCLLTYLLTNALFDSSINIFTNIFPPYKMHFWGSCWLLYQQKQGQGGWRGRGSWLFNSFDTHISLVYDVIAKGCRPQNGSSHCRVLATFRRRPFSKQDDKSNEKRFVYF